MRGLGSALTDAHLPVGHAAVVAAGFGNAEQGGTQFELTSRFPVGLQAGNAPIDPDQYATGAPVPRSPLLRG